MPGAIDQKPTKQRFDQHPRLKRKATKPAPLIDDAEARLKIADEKLFRAALWADFAKFAKSHGAFVVSPPDHSPVRCQVLLSDGEISPLEIAMRALPKYPVVKLPTMAARLAHGAFQRMHELEIVLWRGS
jgi:hypothetical protein